MIENREPLRCPNWREVFFSDTFLAQIRYTMGVLNLFNNEINFSCYLWKKVYVCMYARAYVLTIYGFMYRCTIYYVPIGMGIGISINFCFVWTDDPSDWMCFLFCTI
jgi:hypothetical protein